MFTNFKTHISNNLAFLKNSKLLIAVSGGLDSVVLTHLCYNMGLDIALAHCNFKLRGAESDNDEIFVSQLAKQLKLRLCVKQWDTKAYATKNKLSIQVAARELRYNWFKALTEQFDFNYVLTAHHTDDNLETFLINLSRGTGIEGLTGIPLINKHIVRPLLPFTKNDIDNYAAAQNISYREDSSNNTTKYLRNKLRHDVIPILKEINPKILDNFSKTQSYLQDSKIIIEDRVLNLRDEITTVVSETEIHFDIKKIKQLNTIKPYLYQLFKTYGFTEWDNVYNLLDAQSGKQLITKTHSLLKNREVLILSKISLKVPQCIPILETDTELQTPLGRLCITEVKYSTIPKHNTSSIYIDKAQLKFPLVIRQWQKGDYFYPLGMTGKKKLSHYFKDEKIALIHKQKIWLLCSDNKIIWIINKRQDRRFKVTEHTKTCLIISLKKD